LASSEVVGADMTRRIRKSVWQEGK
jgi:hypothetical protein